MNTVSEVKTFQIRQIIETQDIKRSQMNKAKCKQTSDHKIHGDNKKLQSWTPPLKTGDENKNKRLRSELRPEQTGTGKKRQLEKTSKSNQPNRKL